MAKVFRKGHYVEINPNSFERPHEDMVYLINGRRYKFILCHYAWGGIVKGYNTHTKKWFDLYNGYVQMEGALPIGADIVEGTF